MEKIRKQVTVCPYCGSGCGLYFFEEGFVVPAQNHPVSRGKLCMRGWGYADFAFTPGRLRKPIVKGKGKVEWEEAIKLAGEELGRIKRQYGGEAIGVLGSARSTMEENLALLQFAKTALGSPHIDSLHRWGFLPSQSFSYQELERAKEIILFYCDPAERQPQVASFIISALIQGASLYVIDVRMPQLSKFARQHVQVPPHELLNRAEALLDSVEGDNAFLVFSSELALSGWGAYALSILEKARSRGVKTLFLSDYSNQRGMVEMGIYPQEGLSFYEMLREAKEGRIKALVILSDDPSERFPKLFEEARQNLEFLLVLDALHTKAVDMADVAIPGTFFFEKEGTVVNSEGRRQPLHPTVPPLCKSEIETLLALGEALGTSLPYPSGELVEMERKPWEVAPSPTPPTFPSSPDFPFWLVIDPSYIWNGTAMAKASAIFGRESSIILQDYPQGFVNINSEDAKELRIRDRMSLTIETPQGSLTLPAFTSLRAGKGMLLIPFFIGEKAGEALGSLVFDGTLKYPYFQPLPARIKKEE